MDPDQSGARGFPVFNLQPIADTHHRWVGMLLGSDGDAGAEIGRLFGAFGLAEALGPLQCVIPCNEPADRDSATMIASWPRQVVVLCTARHGAAATALDALRQEGFRVVRELAPDQIDLATDADALAWHCAVPLPLAVATALRQRPGPHLALGVDTQERFEQCKATGFAWLAGDYPLHYASLNFSRGRGPAHPLLLKLLALVVRDADTREIEAVLKQDPQLSFQLLRLVNSAAFAHPTPIATFNQAITMLGRRQLQRWLQLLLYANPSGAEQSPLLPRAAYRARFMEALSEQAGASHEQQDRAFMAGMFSLLDAVFGRSLAELLRPLELAAEVVEALLKRSGHLGNLLEIVCLERAKPMAVPLRERLQAANLDAEKHARAMVAACHWAVRVGRD